MSARLDLKVINISGNVKITDCSVDDICETVLFYNEASFNIGDNVEVSGCNSYVQIIVNNGDFTISSNTTIRNCSAKDICIYNNLKLELSGDAKVEEVNCLRDTMINDWGNIDLNGHTVKTAIEICEGSRIEVIDSVGNCCGKIRSREKNGCRGD